MDRPGSTGNQSILIGGRSSHIPLPPDEQHWLPLLSFFLILLLFIFSHFLNKFTQFKKTKFQNFQNLHSVQPENRGFKKIFMPFFNMMGRVVSPPHFRKQNTLGVKYLRFKAVRKYIHLFHKNRDRMTT